MNNIYKRIKQIWNQTIIAEETDKIKDINYEVDEERSGIKSGKRYHYSSISFHFIKDSEKNIYSFN